jgi:hypothetical protein
MLQDQTNIQLKTSFQTLPADGESHLLYVLARVAPKIAAAPRLPLNLSILLDTSGSMREQAMIFVSAAPLLSATKSGMVGTAKLT